MKRMTTILSALLLVPTLAFAQPTTPDDWYKEGENQYNLGNFEKAIDAFKKGFELEPSESKKAAYLFNIAQSYRQAKNCKDAQFFYKRYLAFKDADTKKPLAPDKRKEIEDRISELEECARQQDALTKKPPDVNPDNGGGGDPKRVGDVTPPPVDIVKGPEEPVETLGTPKVLSMRLVGGGAKLSTGALDVPIQATVGLIGGYPLSINEKLLLELGGAFTFTPVPFEDAMGENKSASLIALMANLGATYTVAPKIGLRGDLGVGLLMFGGVSESPFTDFAETTGTLSMPHVRIAVSADYAITNNVLATLTPFAFSFSPGKDGLRAEGEDISSITSIEFMVGIGYRR
ncbi:MAG: tetratricopeptide repeat protein [Deltaproteobacteria bacterium]|nr:tetratricopeptide repeat protein [Deltaproteobacteria bacterium]